MPALSQQCQETSLGQANPEGPQDTAEPSPQFDPTLNLPIAHRKGVRSCTQHPLRSCISYSNLSPKFQAFVTSLDKIKIPSSVYEALTISEWHKAILEEYSVLEKNGRAAIRKENSGL